MVSTDHQRAVEFFNRDVTCIKDYFKRKFGLEFEDLPRLETDVERKADLDKEIKASGFLRDNVENLEDMELLEAGIEGDSSQVEEDKEEKEHE